MAKIFNRRVTALTLTELLVVMVIIGILVLLALPNLMPTVTKAKATEAKLQLEHVHRLQKAYHMEHSRYTEDLSAIGFEQEPLKDDEGNGSANYRITVTEATPTSFIAVAESVVDFDGDGQLNKWTINEEKNLKETVPD